MKLADNPAVVAVLFFPDIDAGPAAGPLVKVRSIERYKRNSRPPDYVRERARAESKQDGKLIGVPEARDPALVLTAARLEAAQEIVLLWPDSIGYGWWPIERRVFASKSPATRVSVLNGRRRRFTVTRSSLLSFRVRRVAERLWLGEIAMAAGVLVAAPFLVTWDAIRGRA